MAQHHAGDRPFVVPQRLLAWDPRPRIAREDRDAVGEQRFRLRRAVRARGRRTLLEEHEPVAREAAAKVCQRPHRIIEPSLAVI